MSAIFSCLPAQIFEFHAASVRGTGSDMFWTYAPIRVGCFDPVWLDCGEWNIFFARLARQLVLRRQYSSHWRPTALWLDVVLWKHRLASLGFNLQESPSCAFGLTLWLAAGSVYTCTQQWPLSPKSSVGTTVCSLCCEVEASQVVWILSFLQDPRDIFLYLYIYVNTTHKYIYT